MMMDAIGVRSNFKVHNIVTTYANTAGDSPIGTLAFGLIFENPDYIPTTGTAMDGSTTTSTKAGYIADKIGEALSNSRTENMSVFNPTSGVAGHQNNSVSVGPVMLVSQNEIVDAITVTEVTAFAPNTSGQLASDTSLTYSAE
jgi:hypothetical protein